MVQCFINLQFVLREYIYEEWTWNKSAKRITS